MSEKRFTFGPVSPNFAMIKDNGKPMDTEEVVDCLNEQQATISALKDIFKDIITYSKWDSEKPYCSLGIIVDKKTYYTIRKILNE